MGRIIRTAEHMGYRVQFRDIGRASGYLYGGGLIVLNYRRSELTQRVTLAHELGHAHHGHDWTRDHDRHRDERQADQYAARLLISPVEYAAAEALVGSHAGALARELGVTRRLVELRREDFARDERIIETVEAWRHNGVA
ncbi:ImmA/IrrE family metallo-endopeptidase [Demequina flava]|uniref:ImmA/IrrE family metallo-endopeptidase n=1 Tax=Demequina flava TaxID=1095025 RepID=UPI0007819A66|nr:ImmA/IrrE family metallo-endopeptidase [Demequina flava]